MSINYRRESLLTLKDAANELPGRTPGRSMTYETIRQWIERGRKGVRLESVTIGGTRYTSHEAIDRFISRLNQSRAAIAVPGLRQTKAKQRAIARELRSLGVTRD